MNIDYSLNKIGADGEFKIVINTIEIKIIRELLSEHESKYSVSGRNHLVGTEPTEMYSLCSFCLLILDINVSMGRKILWFPVLFVFFY